MSALSAMLHAATRLEQAADGMVGEQEREYRNSAKALRAAREAFKRLVIVASDIAQRAGRGNIGPEDPLLRDLGDALRAQGGVS